MKYLGVTQKNISEIVMATLKLIPMDNEVFPYDEAKKLILLENPNVQFEKADLTQQLGAGQGIGWTEEMIKENEALTERGNCYSFAMTEAPYIKGTLFEDNLWLEIDPDFMAESEKVLFNWIQELGITVFSY